MDGIWPWRLNPTPQSLLNPKATQLSTTKQRHKTLIRGTLVVSAFLQETWKAYRSELTEFIELVRAGRASELHAKEQADSAHAFMQTLLGASCRRPQEHSNRRILHSGFKAQHGRISENMVCRIPVFGLSVGPNYGYYA